MAGGETVRDGGLCAGANDETSLAIVGRRSPIDRGLDTGTTGRRQDKDSVPAIVLKETIGNIQNTVCDIASVADAVPRIAGEAEDPAILNGNSCSDRYSEDLNADKSAASGV